MVCPSLWAPSDVDILDDFDPAQPAPSTSATASTRPTFGPKPPESSAQSEPDFTDDDFVLQLQKGMEQLMREMETSPAARNEFESLVKSMADATTNVPTASNSFSETLSRTIERMQESESAADAARSDVPSQSETDIFLAEMLRQLDSAGAGDEVGGEAGMAKLLEGMMEQLMSKDILCDPLKDLQEKVRL